MIGTAKREPQVQEHKFSLSSCPAVMWLSLSRAPGQLAVSHTWSLFPLTVADRDVMGLLRWLQRAANQRQITI